MKPGFNHNTYRGKMNDFSWKYYERKIGNYLDFRTPLTASPDGTYGWITRVITQPRDHLVLFRDTFPLSYRGIKRHVKDPARIGRDYLDLTLHPITGPQKYKQGRAVAGYPGMFYSVPDGRPIVYGYELPDLTLRRNDYWCEEKVFDLGVGLPDFHESWNAFVAACAARGEFRVIPDWLSENFPPLAPYFQSAGEMP